MKNTLKTINVANWKTIAKVYLTMKKRAHVARLRLQREKEKASKPLGIRPPLKETVQGNLLHKRLENLRLCEVPMLGDGNCQFRSFSHELYGTPAHHSHVRRIAIAHMRNHRDDYSLYFGNKTEFREYYQKMKKNAAWGDELTLRALSDAFCVTIHVLTSTFGYGGWYLKYDPGDKYRLKSKIKPMRHVFLTYHSPNHYNVMAHNFQASKEVNSDRDSIHTKTLSETGKELFVATYT